MQLEEYNQNFEAKFTTVHRADEWYESFPDIEITDKGTYLCTFTRATFHCGLYRTILITRSNDGLNWSDPQVVAKPRNFKYKPWKLKKQKLDEHDCSKIQQFNDGHIEISIALSDASDMRKRPALIVYRSVDDGITWDGPSECNCQGIVQDDFLVNNTDQNERIVGLHIRDKKSGVLNQLLYRSVDNGKTWNDAEIIAQDGKTHFCEVSITYIPNTDIIAAFMRDNRRKKKKITKFFTEGYPTQVCFSQDFGKSWTKPVITSINGHRPVAKFLKDGRIVITYRDIVKLGITGLWSANIDASKIKFGSNDENSFNEIFNQQKYYILQYEDEYNSHGDNGYSGWVQNPKDNSIVVVYYTKIGATLGKKPGRASDKRAYIKSAKFNPKDI
jgi:BNR repeat protein